MGNCLQQALGTCCGSRSKKGPLDSINENRTCTDIPFFVALFGTWIAMWVFFGMAIDRGGDPRRLTHGIQYDGKVCGVDLGVQSRPFAVWPDPTSFDFQICVRSCNESNAEVTNTSVSRYFETPYPSLEFFFHCIPDPTFGQTIESFDSLDNVVARGISDLATSRNVILLSLGIALVLSFLYVFTMRYCVAFIVWLTIMLATLFFGALATMLYFYSQEVEDQHSNTAQWSYYASIVAYAATFIWICIILFLRKRIQMATEVVRYAAEAVWKIKILTFFPLFTFVAFLAFLVWWFYVAVYIFSVHAPPTLTPISTVDLATTEGLNLAQTSDGEGAYLLSEFDGTLKNMAYMHFFVLLWNQQVAVYFTYLVVAGVVADWYFTRLDENGEKLRGSGPHELSRFPLIASFKRALFYHMGTVAYGAFVIATIRFIRGMLTYLRDKTKLKNNKLQETVACCCSICFKCLECVCDKISKNAFVYNAIYGDNFCLSALGSFTIVWKNLVRAAAIDLIGDWIIVMGRIYVAAATTAISTYLLRDPLFLADGVDHVSNLFFPIVIIFVISYTVARLVMVIYETTIDTVFLCFLVDEEQNKEAGRMFASTKLRKLVGEYPRRARGLSEAHDKDLDDLDEHENKGKKKSGKQKKGGGGSDSASSDSSSESSSVFAIGKDKGPPAYDVEMSEMDEKEEKKSSGGDNRKKKEKKREMRPPPSPAAASTSAAPPPAAAAAAPPPAAPAPPPPAASASPRAALPPPVSTQIVREAKASARREKR